MELSEYEARRKVQNREAQRRYRQKQRQRGGDTSNHGTNSDDHNRVPKFANANSAELQAGAESHDSLDTDFNELFQDSDWTLAASPSACANKSLDDIDALSTPPYLTHRSRSDHYVYQHTPSVSGPTHNLILSKVDRIVHDLDRLYDFGVDMQLISPNDELKSTLTNVEALFHKSIHKAAKGNEHHSR
ncbi:hypothetical protein LX32DRAFT_701047 [Colletotrichum zoysiae]|uniref:BZIP domain-containing protein n=1 Tax=Colletotrichum zoysiae TaxID=1216348 RepID=A0AAD9M2P3_9PEZI|nr:hypothetical protein LX32DRAFT_701047 [Colletotrichum zoysiae]